MLYHLHLTASLLRTVAGFETGSVKEWLPYLVLVVIGLREVLLLVVGLGSKRRADTTSGGQSIEAWKLGGKQIIADALNDKLKPIQEDLDELLERKRRRR